MIILLVILGVILVLLACLLFINIQFKIDTEESVFSVDQGPLYSARFFEDPDEPMKVRARILFIPFSIDMTKIGKKRREKRKKKKTRKRSGKMSWDTFRKILKSFKVKRLYCNLDTGNVVFNAQLMAVSNTLNAVSADHINVNINNIGENDLKLRITNRPVNIIRAFI